MHVGRAYGLTKAFLKVGKYSIIDHQLKILSKIKKKIIIISNKKISKFNNQLRNKYKDINLKILEESMPLGTGGCLKPLQDYKNDNYLIIMGDLMLQFWTLISCTYLILFCVPGKSFFL